MTPDKAIAIVRDRATGRTRWEGQTPFVDEVLVEEIERLRALYRAALEELASAYECSGYEHIDPHYPGWTDRVREMITRPRLDEASLSVNDGLTPDGRPAETAG